MVRFLVIFAFACVLLGVLANLLVKYNAISHKMRLRIGIALLVIAVGIGIFTLLQDKSEERVTMLAQSFLQGKNLVCKVGTQDIVVSSEKFNFISGTLTLLGKEEGEHKRLTIPLKACEIENADKP